jgi:hypothetical protein
MDVRTFLLIGGVEFIAEVVDERPDGVVVKNPLRVIYNNHQGQMVVDFALMTLALDEDQLVTVNNSAMLFQPIITTQSIADSYRSQLSGIVVPQAAPQILHS